MRSYTRFASARRNAACCCRSLASQCHLRAQAPGQGCHIMPLALLQATSLLSGRSCGLLDWKNPHLICCATVGTNTEELIHVTFDMWRGVWLLERTWHTQHLSCRLVLGLRPLDRLGFKLSFGRVLVTRLLASPGRLVSCSIIFQTLATMVRSLSSFRTLITMADRSNKLRSS
jgi:hypothetical protein